MEIKLQGYKKVVDDRIDTYSINEMNTNEEAQKLLLFIEQKYGELENIHCIKIENDGNISFDKNYPSLKDCLAEVSNILDLNIITLSCKNQYISFNFDIKRRQLKVTDLRHAYGDKMANEASFKYFEDEEGNVISYNEKTGLYYQLDKESNI